MQPNWIIYLELARDFITQFSLFKKRTPAEVRARNYTRASRKLDREAEGYRKDYAKGRIDQTKYLELSDDILRRRATLNAEYDAE